MLQPCQASSYLLCFWGVPSMALSWKGKKKKSVSKALEKLIPSNCEARHTLHGNLSVVTKKNGQTVSDPDGKRWRHLQIDEK